MDITSGKIESAQKVIIYGPEGIGKSTFASKFPSPLFSDTEGSTKHMDVRRLPKPTSWTLLKEEVAYVKANPTVCKTYIIDTFDWAERLCIAKICADNNKKSIEDFGYGSGYVYELEEIGRFLNSLDELIELGINVVLTAHAQLRKFEQPDEMGAYDRWELKLGKKTSSQISPILKEWADMSTIKHFRLRQMTKEQNIRHRAVQEQCTPRITLVGTQRTVIIFRTKCRLNMNELHIVLKIMHRHKRLHRQSHHI
jgi:hypothetical protein